MTSADLQRVYETQLTQAEADLRERGVDEQWWIYVSCNHPDWDHDGHGCWGFTREALLSLMRDCSAPLVIDLTKPALLFTVVDGRHRRPLVDLVKVSWERGDEASYVQWLEEHGKV